MVNIITDNIIKDIDNKLYYGKQDNLLSKNLVYMLLYKNLLEKMIIKDESVEAEKILESINNNIVNIITDE